MNMNASIRHLLLWQHITYVRLLDPVSLVDFITETVHLVSYFLYVIKTDKSWSLLAEYLVNFLKSLNWQNKLLVMCKIC